MGPRRRLSAAYKRQVVEELLAGAATMAQLCRRHELCPTLLRTWNSVRHDQLSPERDFPSR